MSEIVNALDGRYYVSLWVALQVLAFQHPMPHRRRYRVRAAAGGAALLFAVRWILLFQSYVFSVPLATRLMMGCLATLLILLCCDVPPIQAAYAALWAMVTQQTMQNASSVLLNLVLRQGFPPNYGLYLAIWMAAVLPLSYHLLAIPLFGGDCRITRRLFATASVLFLEFELVQNVPAIKISLDGQSGLNQNYQFVLMNGACILVALYLVHTLSVKRRAEDELAIANALRRSQREQYETARRHVLLINRRCHELKMQLADLSRARTASEQQQCLTRLSEAVDIYDSRLATGNDVLDMALAEQRLYCREHGIRLHCVADGRLLSFVEAADLYTLATCMLRRAVEQTEKLPELQRELDLAIYDRQGMAVLETAWMLQPGGAEASTLPARSEGIGELLHKYGAELFAGSEHGCAVLRCLIPVPKQQAGVQDNKSIP